MLDDYSVHLMPEARKILWDRGYNLLIIGGGVTGFVQFNDTHLQKQLKNEYRKKESALMLEKLTKDPQKFPSPDRSEMMSLLVESEKAIALDSNVAFKSVWVTNSLDGSEDYLVSDKIFGLAGDSTRQFGNEMTAKPPPKTVQEVIRSLIPPKGIKRGKNIEGSELFDGEEIEEEDEDEDEDKEEIDVDQLLQVLTGNLVSLGGITESDQINKDAKFLDEIKKVFDEYETSAQFTIENTYRSARNSLKKRIRNEKNSA